MNGELARAVSLVSYGNAWLRRVFDLDSIDWTTHSTLKSVVNAEFRLTRRYWIALWRTVVVRSAPDWLRRAETDEAISLELVLTPRNAPVIAVLYRAHDERWQQAAHAGVDSKCDIRFDGRFAASRPHDTKTVADATEALHTALHRAVDYLRLRKAFSWQQRFAEAITVLDGKPMAIPYHPDLLAAPGDAEHRLAAAAFHIWVFTEQPYNKGPARTNPLLTVVWPELAFIMTRAACDAVAAAANVRMVDPRPLPSLRPP